MGQQLPSSDGKGNFRAHTCYKIEERSHLSVIKKEIKAAAKLLGFSKKRLGNLDIIVSELFSNVIKFGGRNRELLWKPIFHSGHNGIELLTTDKGQGVANVALAFQDGYSTSGTAGEGLGAIQRLSDFFDFYSQPRQGTVALVRIFDKDNNIEELKQAATIAAISIAKQGQDMCGDGYFFDFDSKRRLLEILVLDGLGHGQAANEATEEAKNVYSKRSSQIPSMILTDLNENIKKTRGAVGMSLHYDFANSKLTYCGVGNISGRLIKMNKVKNFFSHNGIIGHTMPAHIHDQEVEWATGELLVLNSDGIFTRWNISGYPKIQNYDPLLLAACIYRDFCRKTDDVTVLVSKHP